MPSRHVRCAPVCAGLPWPEAGVQPPQRFRSGACDPCAERYGHHRYHHRARAGVTCSYPNPEIFEALKLGLELATKTGADLMLATDPDADRVGIAMKCPDGSYELVSGNEMGVLLLDYICAGRIEKGHHARKPRGGQVHRFHPAGRRCGKSTTAWRCAMS